MPRYRDVDDLIERYRRRCIDCKSEHDCWDCEIDIIRSELKRSPVADVVPKHSLEMSEHLLKEAYKRIEELDKLCGDLQKTRDEIAKQIFEEIEKLRTVVFGVRCEVVLFYKIAELKKKYTEGE